MPISEQEWKDVVRARAEKSAQATRATRALLEQAVVRAEHLTKDGEWNFYLSLLMPLLEKAEQACQQAMESLPGAKTEEVSRVCLIQYWYQKGRVDAFNEASSLPKTLRDQVPASVESPSDLSATSLPEMAAG